MRAKGGVKRDISRLCFFKATNHILTGGNGMNSKKIQLLLTGVAALISLLLMITTTYGASIVIGGDYTDIGTIVIISPKPGDTPQANGTALLNNLAGISADANNPYLIKLGPGIYDIGTSSLQLKQYVDVEGSGENTTIITGHIDSSTSGVVRGANNAEIRFLTVENTGGGSISVAFWNESLSLSAKITNVTASASGGTSSTIGVNNYLSSPTMTNVTASALAGLGGISTFGVVNSASDATMTNVTASASGGTSSTIGVNNVYSSAPTMTNVTASASGGTNNYGVNNSSTVAAMTNVAASASGGTTSTGVNNAILSSATMTNVTASASGGTNNYGVNNFSSATMTNVTASASGGTNSTGVNNASSSTSATMTNVTASASGGTTNVGVNNGGSGTIRINHSVIKGSTHTVLNGSEATTYVGNTQLDGGPTSSGGGILTCAGVYDETYTFYASTCP
jgi:hypothetical protein